jgi:hypothetical protein
MPLTSVSYVAAAEVSQLDIGSRLKLLWLFLDILQMMEILLWDQYPLINVILRSYSKPIQMRSEWKEQWFYLEKGKEVCKSIKILHHIEIFGRIEFK